MPDRASGFCVYNDVAVGIRWLLDQGAERVAYVDVDAHHGDGVERIFWDDPRVLTISLHEIGRDAVPRHRLPARPRRRRRRWATAVNVALPPGTGDAGWLRAFDAVVPAAAARSSQPQRPRHPARLRLPRRRPAGPPDADRGRPARRLRRPARPGARAGRRPLGGDRRRRLRDRRRGAAGLDATCSRSSPAGRSTPRRRPRRPGASYVADLLRRARAVPAHRRAEPRWRRLGARGTTRRPRSTGRSTRPAARCSRCTVWTPAVTVPGRWTDAHRPDIRRVQCDTPSHRATFLQALPHESHQALFSRERARGSSVGKPVACRTKDVVCHGTRAGDISEVKFLTVAEVAAMMRVSKMTVYRLVHDGDLPAVRVGRSFRVTEHATRTSTSSAALRRRLSARRRATRPRSPRLLGRPRASG